MKEVLITSGITTVLTTIIFWLFSIYYPIKRTKKQSYKSKEALRKEFRKVDFLLLFFFILSTLLFLVLFYQFFLWLSDLRFSKEQADGFLFLPEAKMWMIPSLLSGLGLTAFIFLNLQKKILKERYNDYAYYSSLKYGLDTEKVSILFVRWIFVLVSVFFILEINHFASFREDTIHISDFFQLSVSDYEYDDITAVKSVAKLTAPNGNIVTDKHYIIDFSDKEKWSSRHGGISNYDKDTKMIQFILAKTGLALQHVEFDNP